MSLDLGSPLELELEQVTVRDGPDRPLRGLDLAVIQGSWLGVLDAEARAGAPLLAAVSGTRPVERGRIRLAGAPIERLSARERVRLGLARTFSAFPPPVTGTVGAYLVQAARFARHDVPRLLREGPPRAAEWRAAGETLGLFELEGLLDHPCTGLPVHYRQCIEIARVLGTGARVLLLDRPFRGLSAGERERLAEILERRLRPRGPTVLLLDDDTRLLARLCDRVAVLHRGRLLAEDTPERIGARPDVMRALVG